MAADPATRLYDDGTALGLPIAGAHFMRIAAHSLPPLLYQSR